MIDSEGHGVTLKEYIERRLMDLQELRQQSELALERRMQADAVERFADKGDLRDFKEMVTSDIKELRTAALTLLPIKEHERFRERVDTKLNELDKIQAVVAGKASQAWLYLTAGISLLALILGIVDAIKG